VSRASSAGAPDRDRDTLDTFLGTRAIQERLVTPDQLKEALAEQAHDLSQREAGVRPLGAILVAKGFLTPAQLQSLILTKSKSEEAPPASVPFGKYRLIRELGRGGMGIVYEAVDSALGRKVALKTMIISPQADPENTRLDEERFLREGQLSASLPKHPNIVGVYEVGVIQGRRYLAMELIDGKPMSEWRSRESVTLRQEVEVLRTAALAVHHAHEHDIIHRDLKPPNILVDARNEPHITDFGLAKLVGQNLGVSLTGAGMVVGTPAYISPEQAQGLRTTDRRTDVYALGVILFELLAGRPPFQGETAMEILMKAAKNPVPSATTFMKVRLTPTLAKGLDDICRKALAKKPVDRYRDAAAFAADLTKWLNGDEVQVQCQTRRMIPPRNRRWALGLTAGIVLAGLGILLFRGSPAPTPDRAGEEKKRAEPQKPGAGQRAAEERAKAAESELKAMNARLLKAIVGKNPDSLRPGFVAEYFGGTNFEIPSLRKIETDVSLQWKAGPAWPEGPAEMYSLRWRGFLRIPESGPYVFQVWCNDGSRLFIDGVEILSNWTVKPASLETGISFLEQGLHAVVLESFKTGPGVIAFSWKKGNEAGSNLGNSFFLHDPATFTPLARKPAWEHIDWESLPGAQEAETLPILEAPPGSTFVLPFGRKKGVLLWGKGTKIGDRLRIGFDAPEPGEKTLILALSRLKNAGIFRIAVNGTVLAKELDLYSANNHVLESEFSKVSLRKGQNDLEFRVVGSNPSAVEWKPGDGILKLGLDYLRIR
jgi:serine/threonine protein kinase